MKLELEAATGRKSYYARTTASCAGRRANEEQTRQVIAGPEGLSYVVIGSRPGAYIPRS